MTKQRILLSLITLSLSLGLTAQTDTLFTPSEKSDSLNLMDFSKRALLKEGDRLFEQGAYYDAIPYYAAADAKIKSKKKKHKLEKRLGEVNYQLRDYQQALHWFKKALANDKKKKDGTYRALLAHSYKYIGEYNAALKAYRDYLSGSFKKEADGRFVRIAQKGAQEALAADTLALEPEYQVTNPGGLINDPFTEFGPTFDADGNLVFAKILSQDKVKMNNGISEKTARLYRAEQDGNGYFLAQEFASSLNNDSVHTGNPSFTPDGKTLFFTKCTTSSESMQITCAIYRSYFENGRWTEEEYLKTVNKEGSSTTHPMVSSYKDGLRLWFASNRRGRGGMDIWYSDIQEDSTFSIPKNAGTPINTPYDDISPYYNAQDQHLYFSSEGHPGFGGFDVFQSTYEENDEDWTEPTNLGRPINSSYDDIHLVFNANESKGALVSNRIGTTPLHSPTCCDDIFLIQDLNPDLFAGVTVYERTDQGRNLSKNARFVFYNPADSLLHDNAQSFKGTTTFLPIQANSSYRLTAFAPGFDSSSVTIETKDITKADTLFYDLFLDPSAPPVVESYDSTVVGTVYWAFNKFRLTQTAPDTLDKVVAFLEKHPAYFVEVGSHTDNKGSKEYNIALSKKRSDAVIKYLKSRGIDESRISAGYYGESKPVAPNTNPDGTDNEEGRAKNRRTEFVVNRTQEVK